MNTPPGSIKHAKWKHCIIPLVQPYHLQYADITQLDSVFFFIETEDGKIGYGESTPLQGYTNTQLDDIIECCARYAGEMIGHKPHEVFKDFLRTHFNTDGFLYTAVAQALEMIMAGPVTTRDAHVFIPLIVGLEIDNKDCKWYLKTQFAQGYKNFKIKIGTDVDKDIKNVLEITSFAPPTCRFRLDANQGYSLDEAIEFCKATRSVRNIRLLEQPLQSDHWEALEELSHFLTYPLMLDEDIRDMDDILCAGRHNACQFVKLKLMKCGSSFTMKKMIELARKNNLEVILGNGVQSIVGCLHEMKVYHAMKLHQYPGEMNGFRRMRYNILPNALQETTGGILANLDQIHDIGLWERLT